MSSYLLLAEKVLQTVRRPLTPRAILHEGFKRRLVPAHLYGETQHKTLQARLSEDILSRREHSAFFRTKPGTFFLREFLTDITLPAEYRQPITARRRTRDLIRGWPLSIAFDRISALFRKKAHVDANDFFATIKPVDITYSPYRRQSSHVPVWALGFVRRGNQLLCYRSGRYRDGRDTFAHKQSLTFASLVIEDDVTLFDSGLFGIENSALAAVSVDLDIPTTYGGEGMQDFIASAKFVCVDQDDLVSTSVLTFVEILPPDWFEPLTKRLSLNDLRWVTFSPPPNNIDDFDPWSQFLIKCCNDVQLRGVS